MLKSQVTVDGGASVAEVAMGNDDKRVNITLDGVKANAAYTVKIKNVKGKNADSAFDYEWTFTTDGGTEFKAPYFGSSAVVIEADASDISLADAVALDNNAYLSGEEWGVKDSSCLANKDGYVWIKPGAEGLLAKKFTPIADGETLNLDAVIYVKAIGGSGTRAFLSSFGIEGEGAIRKLFCYHHNNYNQTVAVLYNSSEHGTWHQPKDDDTVVSTGTISSVDVNNGKWTEQETNNLLTFKQWPAPNTGKGTQYDGDLALNLTMSPTADGKYELVLTITGSRIEMVSKCTITKAEAMAFDTITLRGNTSAGYNDEGYIGIKSVSADKTLGKPYPVVGENTAMIPYTNLSGADFNADVFVVERDAETGKLVKATIINKENITGESGELECTFEAVEKGNKLDFYVLNDADSMILLSGKTTFEVGE